MRLILSYLCFTRNFLLIDKEDYYLLAIIHLKTGYVSLKYVYCLANIYY